MLFMVSRINKIVVNCTNSETLFLKLMTFRLAAASLSQGGHADTPTTPDHEEGLRIPATPIYDKIFPLMSESFHRTPVCDQGLPQQIKTS